MWHITFLYVNFSLKVTVFSKFTQFILEGGRTKSSERPQMAPELHFEHLHPEENVIFMSLCKQLTFSAVCIIPTDR